MSDSPNNTVTGLRRWVRRSVTSGGYGSTTAAVYVVEVLEDEANADLWPIVVQAQSEEQAALVVSAHENCLAGTRAGGEAGP